jgi:hypothetical protein
VVDTSEHLALTLNDLNMLVGAGGRQRTQEEFAELLKSAGFRSVRVIPTASNFCLIEAVPLTSE